VVVVVMGLSFADHNATVHPRPPQARSRHGV